MFGAFFILINYYFAYMGTFVISKRFNEAYKFEFTSRKGKTIFTSNNYELKFECEEDIEIIKTAIAELQFLKFKSSRGKFFFKILLNEKAVAISRKYSTELMLQKGINEIVKYASVAEILDFSSRDEIFQD